jgi:osmoprotectant transport system substrate-binding protein
MTATRKIARTIRGSGLMRAATLVVVVCTVVAGCTDSDAGLMRRPSTGGSDVIVVGVSGAFAENQIVAEMYAQSLEDAGYTVDRQTTLESREALQPALEGGDIDIAPEYLSSLLLYLDPEAAASGDPAENRSLLEPLLGDAGQSLLDSSEADDTNSFVVTSETAEQYGLVTTSDLAKPAE